MASMLHGHQSICHVEAETWSRTLNRAPGRKARWLVPRLGGKESCDSRALASLQPAEAGKGRPVCLRLPGPQG